MKILNVKRGKEILIEIDYKKENEKKKEYLSRYLQSKKAAERIEQEIEEVRLNKMFPSLVMSDMPSSHEKRDLSDYIVKVDMLVDKLIQESYRKINIYTDIFNKIERLENENERQVLTLRYIRGWKWEKIACELGYAWTRIHEIHSKALEHFQI